MLSVFLPHTPNPTTGFLIFVPRSDVTLLDMSVEEAAKRRHLRRPRQPARRPRPRPAARSRGSPPERPDAARLAPAGPSR